MTITLLIIRKSSQDAMEYQAYADRKEAEKEVAYLQKTMKAGGTVALLQVTVL